MIEDSGGSQQNRPKGNIGQDDTNSLAGRTPLEAAEKLQRAGIEPVPVLLGEKKSVVPGWQKGGVVNGDLERHFSGRCNVGALLGAASGGLVDVDLDSPQSRALEAQFLPPTDCVFGRRSSRSSHHFYYVTPIPKPQVFRDPAGGVLVEIRSDGQMTVIPPSLHETGEYREWEKAGLPSHVSEQELIRAVSTIAACALLARHWPARGSRHEASLALAGMLLRCI